MANWTLDSPGIKEKRDSFPLHVKNAYIIQLQKKEMQKVLLFITGHTAQCKVATQTDLGMHKYTHALIWQHADTRLSDIKPKAFHT